MTDQSSRLLKFTSQTSFVQRLVLATLTGRPVHISQIRPSSTTNLGLAPHEISFLRLLEAITNGSHIEISYTGTTLVYKPGLITGSGPGSGAGAGGVTRHEIPESNTRGISYYLLPLCLLAPFSKAKLNVLLTGPGVITSATATGDISADTVRTAILPLYAKLFGIERDIELRIHRRANATPAQGPGAGGGPSVGGEVQLVFGHQVRLPPTLHLLNPGRVKRVRGVAYSTGVSGSNNARMIEEARGILNALAPDTYIFSDVSSAPRGATAHQSATSTTTDKGAQQQQQRGRKSGIGFGLSLVAESSTGCLYSADVASPPEGGITPEMVGRQCACQLLESISRGGCVSLTAAPTVLTLMAMGSEDVGRVRLSKDALASESVIGLARDLRSFGASAWGIRDTTSSGGGGGGGSSEQSVVEEAGDALVSIVGKGVGNVGRKIG